ncbi:MAG: N-acetylmuramoyl-L-alanine amidase [Lachnospiraceae bacterium]|nr:N-acetylmuramoyl-L-alanine amidase [Lachnospiraceae bacterium]
MKKRTCLWMTLFLLVSMFVLTKENVSAKGFRFEPDTDGELVIVIDPGHGGENLGADYEGTVEKEITMVVANAMKEHLLKYEDVTVYLTREEDKDLSLLERAQFAQSVNADYLFCLHFNMSEYHTLYGAEVWIQSQGIENQEGYRFGSIWLSDIKDHGLYLRGIKTRLNSKGTDYYGILRHCKEFSIPAALIEHCHLDHLADSGFADSEEDLISLGILDAEAVAKYFGLSSKELGIDYSDYPLVEITPGEQYMAVDSTSPDMCYVEVESCDYETGEITLSLMAYDIDTPMLYYQYSVDGGETFTPLISWPKVDMLSETSPDYFTFSFTVKQETSPKIVVRVHNKYNVTSDSNLLSDFHVFPTRTKDSIPESSNEVMDQSQDVFVDTSSKEEQTNSSFNSLLFQSDNSFLGFMLVILVLVTVLFLSLIVVKGLNTNRKKSRKK